jgi:hypothetical protein
MCGAARFIAIDGVAQPANVPLTGHPWYNLNHTGVDSLT